MFLPVLFLPLLLLPYASSIDFSDNNVFILAGQSNMVGLGGVVNHTWDGLVPPESHPHPSILRLASNLSWVEAREPLHADIDAEYACGIGPGMPFARAVLGDPAVRVVGLVPCAIGGTMISQWAKGEKFYEEMMRRANASLRHGGRIRAVLWYQGESDTRNRTDAESYKEKFAIFVRDVRSDLRSPSLPVIQVGLASGTGAYVEKVREAQLGTNITNVRCVDAKGLPLEPDGLHLNTPAQVRLGLKMAQSFLHSPNSSPPHETSANAPLNHSGSSPLIPSFFWGPLSRFLLMIFMVLF